MIRKFLNFIKSGFTVKDVYSTNVYFDDEHFFKNRGFLKPDTYVQLGKERMYKYHSKQIILFWLPIWELIIEKEEVPFEHD